MGRNPDGAPWCDACYRRAGAARRAAGRRALILAAVTAAEPALTEAGVLRAIDQMAHGRRLGQLADHLQANPSVLVIGPTSHPPVLDRFVAALVVAGAKNIRSIHPTCLDCGRTRPARKQLPGGAVICSACYARRTSTQLCAGCARPRRPYARDEAGHPRCHACTRRARTDLLSLEQIERLTSVLAVHVALDPAQIIDVVTRSRPAGTTCRSWPSCSTTIA
ncbi:hypothetical protein GALL_429400 [mine drainage metagenome]|uniref:Uncharacterized protein n=1 Tax=mine drainage metagenome TaxID=410659 RepID=A0A1J5Q671_9ZZZZ